MSFLKDWIRIGKEKGASDLHLEAGTPAVYRVRGDLLSVGEVLSAETVLQSARELLSASQWEDFLERRSADLSVTTSGTRCRINVFRTVRGVALSVRLLSSFQNSLRDCNLHPDLKKFIEARTGLLIISGPTGSGKSTTLASLIEEINATQSRHIIAVESPIEYFYSNRKSLIRQREVPTHSPSFEQAIVDSMRENPDVLVIGEMRTPDVMRLTLNAAETGHLVLATMHSSTCAEALSRICNSFPAEIQGSIRAQLADSLVGVICQRLQYMPAVQMRVPYCEVLTGSSAARASIRSGQFSQIASVIQTGGEDGMWSFDRYQRWVEQKRDWVKPSQARPIAEDVVAPSVSALESSKPRATPFPPLVARKTSEVRKVSDSDSKSGAADRIEISATDEDLESLVKKIAD